MCVGELPQSCAPTKFACELHPIRSLRRLSTPLICPCALERNLVLLAVSLRACSGTPLTDDGPKYGSADVATKVLAILR